MEEETRVEAAQRWTHSIKDTLDIKLNEAGQLAISQIPF